MNADDFRIGVFDGDEDIGPAFPDGDRLRHDGAPHFIDLVGDDPCIVRLGLGASTRCGACSRSPASPVAHGEGSREPQQSASRP